MRLYTVYPSTQRGKKYSVIVLRDGRPTRIHFGDTSYGQFKDATLYGHWAHLDHRDERRRKAWYARHGRTTDIDSALFWAARALW